MKNKNNTPSGIKRNLENNIFSRMMRRVGWLIDLMFKSKIILLIVAIIASTSLYFYVNGQPDGVVLSTTETRVLENIKVEVKYDDLTSVVKLYDNDMQKIGLDDVFVDAIISGPRNDVLKTVNNSDYKFFIDATNVVEGDTKEVAINYSGIPDTVSVQISPANVIVEKDRKIVKSFDLVADASNTDEMAENITLESITLSNSEVQVSGSKEDIDSIATVRALVDVSSVNKAGEYEFDATKIKLAAYNQIGNRVEVDLQTKELTATVVASDYYKEVGVNYIFEGDLPEGKSIGSYTTTVESVRIYGEKDKLNEIEEVDAVVNVNDVNDSSKVTAKISKPDGVTSISDTEATVSITLEDTTSKTIEKVQITYQNLASGFSVNADEENGFIDVKVTGAKSVIDSMTKEDIIAAVDLKDLPAGEHTVKIVIVNGDNRVKYTPSKNQVVITIYNTN